MTPTPDSTAFPDPCKEDDRCRAHFYTGHPDGCVCTSIPAAKGVHLTETRADCMAHWEYPR